MKLAGIQVWKCDLLCIEDIVEVVVEDGWKLRNQWV